MVTLSRPGTIAPKILYLDGLTGTGKTMMGPLLGSFEHVELGRFDHLHEYLCILDAQNKIEPDAAEFMLSMYADLGLYNSMIARETNFRLNDLSGVFKNPHTFRYLMRLFQKDGEGVLNRIADRKPVYQVISHQALAVMNLAFRTFGNRLRIVEMVRHPYYLLEHWYSYIDRHGTDALDFTICLEHSGKLLPWFAAGWEKRYVEASSLDKVIFTFDWLGKRVTQMKAKLSAEESKQVLSIPFEHFVLAPDPYLGKIEQLLETGRTTSTSQVLKVQKVPRTQVAAGPAKSIYKRYGWKKPEVGVSDKKEMQKKREFAAKLASEEGMQTLENLAKDYQQKYGLWF